MKSIFDPGTAEEVCSRIDRLTPQSQRQWGKMDVAQMLAHLNAHLEMAVGDQKPKRMLIGRLIGRFFRNHLTDDNPMKRNAPTAPSLKVADAREFEREREKLKELVRRFQAGGAAKCTTHPNPFFGALTPEEWAKGVYKHADHHLQQFGV